MNKTIDIELSASSIEAAIRELESYANSFDAKVDLFMARLAEYGVQCARDNLWMNGTIPTKGIPISSSLRAQKEGDGWIVVTDSEHAAFVEFGTGFVGQGTYSGELPPGYSYNTMNSPEYHDVDNPDRWHFWVNGVEYTTEGQEAQRFMGRAAVQMERKVVVIAREVFR